MSVQAMSRVMSDSDAKGVTRLVLLVMANRAGGDHDVCFASVDQLAQDCRVDIRTIQRNVTKLVRAGELVPVGRHPQFSTNQYQVIPLGVAERRGTGRTGPALPPERNELGSELGSVGSSPWLGTTAQAADAAVDNSNGDKAPDDPFPAEDWRYLLGKLHAQGWTAKGKGALTWAYLMRLRNIYGSRVVDSALRDATYNDTAPDMSAAAYFRSICERFKAAEGAATMEGARHG